MKAVLFDVDGTLVDSNYLHTVSWWEAFGQADVDEEVSAAHGALYGTYRGPGEAAARRGRPAARLPRSRPSGRAGQFGE